MHREMRHLMGDNLVDLPNAPWLSRKRTLQPLFTKQRVRAFSGHMSRGRHDGGREVARQRRSRSGRRGPPTDHAGSRKLDSRNESR